MFENNLKVSNGRVYKENNTIYIYNGYSEEMKKLEETKIIDLKIVDNMSYMPLYIIGVLDEDKLSLKENVELFNKAIKLSDEQAY